MKINLTTVEQKINVATDDDEVTVITPEGVSVQGPAGPPTTVGTPDGGLSIVGNTITLQDADATHDGALTKEDWATFNSKQAALGYTPENIANKSTETDLGGASPSNTEYPSQAAVKTYIDTVLQGYLAELVDLTAVPFVGSGGQLNTDVANFFFDNSVKKLSAKRVDIIAEALTSHVYVSTTGSDSNDGLTALTPFLTLEKALDSIPLLIPGVYQVNLAAGSYTLGAAYTVAPKIAKSGNSDFHTIIKVVGANKATTTIAAFSNSTNIFNLRSNSVLLDLDKVTLSGGSIQINNDGGMFFAREVDFTNYMSRAVSTVNFGSSTLVAGTGTKNFTPSPSSSLTTSIYAFNYGVCYYFTDLVFSNIRGSLSSAMTAATFGRINRGTGGNNVTITADVTSPPRYGILVSTFGAIFIGGGAGTTVSITGPITTTTTGYGGIRLEYGSFFNSVANTNFTFTNVSKAISLDPGAYMLTSGGTWSFNTVTTPLEISHSAIAISSNGFSSAIISYVETGRSSALGQSSYGYDDRYLLAETSSYSSPSLITASITIPSQKRSRLFIAGNGAPVVDPVLGSGVGTQELELYCTDAVNTITLNSVANLKLSGAIVMTQDTVLKLEWVAGASKWVEVSRNGI